MNLDRERLRGREGAVPPAAPPRRVGVPVNLHRWENITFLHWPFEPSVLAPLVPEETTVLTHEGSAWVSVTPFFIRVRPPGIPSVPRVGAFPETNVRTYVTGPGGREGLWFLRMEVTQLWFVLTLRALGLPYVRRRMAVEEREGRIAYTSRPSHEVVVRPGEALSPLAGGPRDRFLTARWGAYHRQGPVLFFTPADHPPWTLQTVAVATCEVGELFRSAGLPAPGGPPLAHFSRGVAVRIGRPEVVN
jgi:uncharacterized protein